MGAMFGAAIGAAMLRPPLTGAMLGSLSGAVDFATLTALIGGAEHLLPRTRLGNAFERAPFLTVFGIKAVVYSAVILAVVGGRLGPNIAILFADQELVQEMQLQFSSRVHRGLLIPTAFLVTL